MLFSKLINGKCYSYLALLYCFLIPFLLISNNNSPNLDSLKQVIHHQEDDSTKVKNLLTISFAHHQIDIALCKAYAQQALTLSQKLHLEQLEARAYKLIGMALNIEGNAPLAIEYTKKSLEKAQQIKDEEVMAGAYNNLGIFHDQSGDLEKALSYLQSALRINERLGLHHKVGRVMGNIVNVHLSSNNLELADQYTERVIELAEQKNIKSLLAFGYTSKGEYHIARQEYKTALSYLQKVHDFEEKNKLFYNLAETLQMMSDCQLKLGYKELAYTSLAKAEVYLTEVGEQQTALHKLQLSIANFYLDSKKFNQALTKGTESLQLATKNGLKEAIIKSYQFLAKVYEEMGHFEEALHAHKAASLEKDSLFSHQRDEVLLELETKYQTGKKDLENELLRSQQEKSQTEIKTKNIFLTAIILIVGLISCLTFLLYRAYKTKGRYSETLQKEVTKRTQDLARSNEQLKQSNEELERFAFIASHDLKTPLHNIINFSNLLERHLQNQPDKHIQKCVNYIKDGSHRMKNLIEDVLEFSKLNTTVKETTHKDIDLNQLVDEIKKSIVSYLEIRNAQIVIRSPLPTIYGNSSAFYILFKNLIENAIKYNESSVPTIKLYASIHENNFSLFFEDNGIGIPKEHHDKIWEMFNRLHTHTDYEGTGLGLATCKKIVDSLGGTFHLNSTVGSGSTFELKIPKTYLVEKNIKIKNHNYSQIKDTFAKIP